MSERDKVPRWVLWLGVSSPSGWLLYTLRGVLAPVFFAFLIAYMLDPLVDRIEGEPPAPRQADRARRRHRGALGGRLRRRCGSHPGHRADGLRGDRELCEAAARARGAEPGRVGAAPGRVRLEVPTSVGQAFEELHLDVQSVLTKGYTPATAVVKWLLGGTASAVWRHRRGADRAGVRVLSALRLRCLVAEGRRS